VNPTRKKHRGSFGIKKIFSVEPGTGDTRISRLQSW
jgi:hypothetical protein